jgi:hypothetical protein
MSPFELKINVAVDGLVKSFRDRLACQLSRHKERLFNETFVGFAVIYLSDEGRLGRGYETHFPQENVHNARIHYEIQQPLCV